MLERILPHAKTLAKDIIQSHDIVVDATCGNGHDTLFLQKLVHDGHVYSFDIQLEAIENAKELNHHAKNITFIRDSHGNFSDYNIEDVKVAMFNLGYLPGSDKSITTTYTSTIEAVNQIFNSLVVGGRIIIVVYHGHENGKVEKDKLSKHLMEWDQKYAQVLEYKFINQNNHAPFIICIEKLKESL